MLPRLGWLVWKDLLDCLRSQVAWLVLLSPLLMAGSMRWLSEGRDSKTVALATVGGGGSPLVRVLQDDPRLNVGIFVDLDSARRSGSVLCLQFDPDFAQQLQSGQRPILRLWQDRSRPTQVLLARESLRQGLRTLLGTEELPVDFKIVEGKTRPQDFWFGATAIMAAMSALVVSCSLWIEEKEAGTLEHLLLTPLSASELWVGKLLVSAGLATLATLAVVAVRGTAGVSWLAVVGLTAPACFVFAALGGILGLLAKGPAAASSWTGIVFIACFVPASMSETSRVLSRWAYASPAFYLHDGLQRTVLAQEPVTAMFGHLVVLTVVGSVLTWLGAVLLQRSRW